MFVGYLLNGSVLQSEVHLHSGLENVDVAFRLSIGHVAEAVLEPPLYMRMKVPTHASHQHGQASTVDIGAGEVHI
jgi:hypothetical protein